MENVGFYEGTYDSNFNDTSFSENTRISFPISFLENAQIPAVGSHPKNVVFLTNDAEGVLPAVSKLTPG